MDTDPGLRLLIIDPQNDFCDLPRAEWPLVAPGAGVPGGPALPVPGADADMHRLAALIERIGPRLSGIDVSLDSHHPMDIAHPAWWQDPQGQAPAAFTPITLEDVLTGRWLSRDPARQAASQAYVQQLAAQGKYTLVIWPEHCLIGHWGHNIHAAVAAALDRWSRQHCRPVDYVFKGLNPVTEHYSALRAEVPDPQDAATQDNPALRIRLGSAARVLVAGEALSHCVAGTVRDLAQALGADWLTRVTLLSDASSAVAGFEAQARAFVDEMQSQGLRSARCADLVA